MDEQTTNGLQINDLVKILEILNVVSQRGAIRPDEFTIVGGIYDRIYAFLDSSGILKKEETEESTTESVNAE